MFKDLLSSRWIQGGLVFFVVVLSGSQLYSWHVRRTALLESATIHKAVAAQDSKAQETHASPSTAETQTQSSCCESGDAACCQIPGSPSSQKSAEVATSLSVDTPDVETTEGVALPLSGGLVVPDHIVQEADRFREWKEKDDTLRVKWKEHNRKGDQHLRASKENLVKMLMMLPIETRRQITEKMKSYMLDSQPVEVWDQYEADLYSIGLDFKTEVSPDISDSNFLQIVQKTMDGVEKQREHSKETRELLQEQSELDDVSRDF